MSTIRPAAGWITRPPYSDMYASAPGRSLAFRPSKGKWLGLILSGDGAQFSPALTWATLRDWFVGQGVDADSVYNWGLVGELTSPFDVYGSERERERLPEVRVYFLQCGEDGPVKIGIAQDVRKRMASLQTACPFDLNLLATRSGGAEEERRLHALFAHLRLRGEWFRPEPELVALIEESA